MTSPPPARTSAPGYALGVGLVFVPLVGIPVRFALQEIPPPLVYAGTFLLGLALGALFTPRAGRAMRGGP